MDTDMDLITLKNYLRKQRLVPLQDVAMHFRVDVETVRPLLDVWVNKGKAKKHAGNLGCQKGCCKCDPSLIETYEWIG
jgi:hypothetical protein